MCSNGADAYKGYAADTLTGVEENLGSGVNQIGSRLFAAESGRTSWRYVGMDLLSRFMRSRTRRESARLIEEALYNGELAKDLADALRIKSERPAVARRLNSWLFAIGANEGDAIETDSINGDSGR